jgi:LacI family transcriptional regulator
MFSAWTEHWGRDATAMLLQQHPEIDAVFCGSDQIARGALDSARDLGRRVPDDLAVIGYDNWEVLAENSRPELTSIDANLQQLGRQAAQRVFEAIDGVDIGSGVRHLPVRLTIRGSTIAHR